MPPSEELEATPPSASPARSPREADTLGRAGASWAASWEPGLLPRGDPAPEAAGSPHGDSARGVTARFSSR